MFPFDPASGMFVHLLPPGPVTEFPRDPLALEAYFKAMPLQGYQTHIDLGTQGIYGEITVEGVQKMCQDAEQNGDHPVHTFLDLGSGVGKACLAAALFGPASIERSLGIELAKNRTEIGNDAIDGLHKLLDEEEDESKRNEERSRLEKVKLMTGDFLDLAAAWIASADLIWISNMCFPSEVNLQLGLLIDAVAQENCIIYASCPLPISRIADPVRVEAMPQSWQPQHKVNRYVIRGPVVRRTQELVHVRAPCPSFAAAIARAFTFWSRLHTITAAGHIPQPQSPQSKPQYEDVIGEEEEREFGPDQLLPAGRVHNAVADALLFLTDAAQMRDLTPLKEAQTQQEMMFEDFEALCQSVADDLNLRKKNVFSWFPFCASK